MDLGYGVEGFVPVPVAGAAGLGATAAGAGAAGAARLGAAAPDEGVAPVVAGAAGVAVA